MQVHEAEEWENRAEAALCSPPPNAAAAAASDAADASNGSGAAQRQALRELVQQSEALSVSVAVSATLRLRAWREEVTFVRGGDSRTQLRELTDLLGEGKSLKLHEGPGGPSQAHKR